MSPAKFRYPDYGQDDVSSRGRWLIEAHIDQEIIQTCTWKGSLCFSWLTVFKCPIWFSLLWDSSKVICFNFKNHFSMKMCQGDTPVKDVSFIRGPIHQAEVILPPASSFPHAILKFVCSSFPANVNAFNVVCCSSRPLTSSKAYLLLQANKATRCFLCCLYSKLGIVKIQ